MSTNKQGGTTLGRPNIQTGDPLLPFEESQLRTLLNQYHATPERVRREFLATIGTHVVVPLRVGRRRAS